MMVMMIAEVLITNAQMQWVDGSKRILRNSWCVIILACGLVVVRLFVPQIIPGYLLSANLNTPSQLTVSYHS